MQKQKYLLPINNLVTTCAFVTLFVIVPLGFAPLGGAAILLDASAAVAALPVKLMCACN